MADDLSVLRLVDRLLPTGSRRVVVSWESPGLLAREASVDVDVHVDPLAAEKVRWYLED